MSQAGVDPKSEAVGAAQKVGVQTLISRVKGIDISDLAGKRNILSGIGTKSLSSWAEYGI